VCDTLVRLTDDGVLFAKNSDRDPNEAQFLEHVPAATHAASSEVRCTWISVPQVKRTNAVLLSRPWWIWGAEMGANEHGVVIGNEAVFTRARREPEDGLIGMDLLRLALERAATAEQAVSVIVELLERHGQGGSCSHAHPRFQYDNSFIVADPVNAIVLETAGREWAVEPVKGAARTISNGLTIPGFAERHSDPLRNRVAACVARRTLTRHAARTATGPADLMRVLRSHGTGPDPQHSIVNGAMSAPCMHAGGGVITNSQTTASWVSDLRTGHLHWVTGTSAPCTSLFKPLRIDEEIDLGPHPNDRFDDESLWWRHERLHRAVMGDPGALIARYAHERDRLESTWLEDPPLAQEAFAIARRAEEDWFRDVVASGLQDHRPWRVRRYWAARNREAGLTVEPEKVLTRTGS
jgi:secernin